jgi:hypothetical protein
MVVSVGGGGNSFCFYGRLFYVEKFPYGNIFAYARVHPGRCIEIANFGSPQFKLFPAGAILNKSGVHEIPDP